MWICSAYLCSFFLDLTPGKGLLQLRGAGMSQLKGLLELVVQFLEVWSGDLHTAGFY